MTKKKPFSQETLTKTLLQQKKHDIKRGLPVRKKTFLPAGFISALFFIAITEANFGEFAQANPYMHYEFVSPPASAKPLEISVSSPKNNTLYRVNDITFTFSISTENTSIHYLLDAYFKANWMQDNVTVYKQNLYHTIFPEFWNHSETFLQMPDGKYSIVITARGGGGYAEGLTYNFFDMTTISVINFTVDTTPPKVSVLSLENKTYYTSDLPLNFTVSEPVSQIAYSLDGRVNVTIPGNTTLTGLSNGVHNVTVYAWDVAGNAGASETIHFNVEVPELFPTELVTIGGASAAFFSVGLVTYNLKFKKRMAKL